MRQPTWGPIVKGRVRRFLEAFLSSADELLFDRDFHWQEEDAARPKLVITTKRRFLERQTHLKQREIYEAIESLKALEILEDRRNTTRGSEEWYFALRLWSKDKAKNLSQFDKEWESYRFARLKTQVVALTESEGRAAVSEIDIKSELCRTHLEAEKQSAEVDMSIVRAKLEAQMNEEEVVADGLTRLMKPLEPAEVIRQEMLSGIEVTSSIEAAEMTQKAQRGSVEQVMATNLKAETLKLGNLTQES